MDLFKFLDLMKNTRNFGFERCEGEEEEEGESRMTKVASQKLLGTKIGESNTYLTLKRIIK